MARLSARFHPCAKAHSHSALRFVSQNKNILHNAPLQAVPDTRRRPPIAVRERDVNAQLLQCRHAPRALVRDRLIEPYLRMTQSLTLVQDALHKSLELKENTWYYRTYYRYIQKEMHRMHTETTRSSGLVVLTEGARTTVPASRFCARHASCFVRSKCAWPNMCSTTIPCTCGSYGIA